MLQDWNRGRIPFHTEPPARDESTVSASIVDEWAAEFALPAIIKTEKEAIDALPNASVRFLPMAGSALQQADWNVQIDNGRDSDDEESDEEMDDEDEEEDEDEMEDD